MPNIEGVIITPLLQIPDNRGTVKRFIRAEDMPSGFGECYLTTIYKDIIKGWHGYFTKTLNYAVVSGMVKLVLFDIRTQSPTYKQFQEIYLGDLNYCRVTIPPLIMNAFQGISSESVIVVATDEIFNENMTIRKSTQDIPYDWSKINK
jgi:dTDP-4-dehydrorhamnose 3,5-epimerase